MTDQPYTDEDLRAEAARQHATLTEDPDFVGVSEQMEDRYIESTVEDQDPEDEAEELTGSTWSEALTGEQYDEAHRKIADLVGNAADISSWAVDMGADGLEPEDHTLSVDGDGKPLVRLHCAFHPDLDHRARTSFLMGLAKTMADAL